jgi:hypothetical protein
MSDLLRLFTRTAAVIFTTFILLLGGTMLASGAFRPVRFFVAGPGDITMNTLYAVFETGELYPFAGLGSSVLDLRLGLNSVTWLNGDLKMVHWQDGQRQIFGATSIGQNRWSFEDHIAWTQRQTQTPNRIEIGIWNGFDRFLLTRDVAEITQPTWTTDGRLWWLERTTTDQGSWWLMQWDGFEIVPLFETTSTHDKIKFISCGALWFLQETAADPLRLWNGRMNEIPTGIVDPIMDVESWDCQTFRLGNRTQDFVWNGKQLFSFPFDNLQHLDDANTFFGVEQLLNNDDWTISLWRDGQVLQSTTVPQSHLITNPRFTAYSFAPQTILIYLSNISRIGDLYGWDLETNQIYRISREYRIREMMFSFSFQVFGAESDQQLIWCGGPPEETTNTLYQWHPQTDQVSVVQTNALCSTRVMSDGSLIGLTQADSSEPPVFFRWDGHTMHLFPRNDEIESQTHIYSDWMTLE